jgi:hypothetical protein
MLAPEKGRGKMKFKGAQEFLEELVRVVRPPKGRSIVLRECPVNLNDDINWDTDMIHCPPDVTLRYDSAVAELRRQHPKLDWEGITERQGGRWRRIARDLSEVEK